MYGFNPFVHGGIQNGGGFFNPVEEDQEYLNVP
jgi:hypothetical protein